MLDWLFTYEDGPEIKSIWNAVLESDQIETRIRNEAWNGYLEIGDSATFGFIANGEWPPSFTHAELNGMHVHVEGAADDNGHDCPGDFNEDMRISVDDLLIVLAAWGSEDPDIDTNGDLLIGVHELLFVISSWGDCQ
jgi:hypothetical protein